MLWITTNIVLPNKIEYADKQKYNNLWLASSWFKILAHFDALPIFN